MKVDIRKATQEDVPQICALGARHYDESNFEPGGYDLPQMAYTVGYAVESSENEVLVAVQKGVVVAYIIFDLRRYYTKFKVSNLFLLYVSPECRKGAGRMLLKAGLDIAQERGSKYFYATVGAGFKDGGKNDKMLVNSLQRLGFELCGLGVFRKVLS